MRKRCSEEAALTEAKFFINAAALRRWLEENAAQANEPMVGDRKPLRRKASEVGRSMKNRWRIPINAPIF